MSSTNREALVAKAEESVARLRVSYVDAKPEYFDFSENRWDDDGEVRWSSIEAVECDECGQFIVDGDDHAFIKVDENGMPADAIEVGDDEDEIAAAEANGFSPCPRQGEGYTEFDTAEGPMMNYRYQIDDEVYSVESARKIADLPLCLVRDDESENAYLALTGGGMDLSWEICEAYVRLGYYPPSHFSLPDMAGKRLTERNARIVAALVRSNTLLANWATSRREHTERFLSELPMNEEN